jgi:itaconyl-CoA hydratase
MEILTVGSNRYRTSYGRYLEDFALGAIYEHRPGRTITEVPMHCDSHFAKDSEFGQPLVNSAFTLAVVVGMTVNDVSAKAIANLGWKEINLTAPVHPGDTLYAESEVLEVRESKSRPTQGIVTVRTRGFNQDGTEVINFVRSALVPKRGHGVGDIDSDVVDKN